MLKFITFNRFSFIDGCALYLAGVLNATGHYWASLATVLVGAIVCVLLSRLAARTEVTTK